MKPDFLKKSCTYEGCNEEALKVSKEGFCLFHERDENKDKEEFERLLQLKLQRQDYNFRGYTFVGKSVFRDYVFSQDVDFHRARFFEDADFEKVQFLGKAVFNGAKFFRRAIFLGAKFSAEGKAEFRQVTFESDALFSGVEFFGEALFWQAEFLNEALFWHTKFFNRALFLDARFQGGKKVDFRGAVFAEEALFTGVELSMDALFCEGKFLEKAIFKDIKFLRGSKADFQKAAFAKETLFKGATFSGDALFQNAAFSQNIDFEGTRFFREINFGSTDLGIVRLAESNIDTQDLTNAKWSSDFKNVYEKTAETIEDLRKAEEIYRKVKISYHRTGDYDLGAAFYYREMETKRKQVRFEKTNPFMKLLRGIGFNFLRIYCGYGEKPLRVIGCSLLTIIVCALLFMVFGIYDSEGAVLIKLDLNDFFYDFGIHTLVEKLENFWSCFYYSVITFTTVGYGDIRPTTGLARLLAMAEGFFGAFSIALFVLTFGRKMMR